MSYKVLNKAPKVVEGQVVSTIIDIKQDEPYTILSRELDGDHTQSTDKKLIESVLEVVNEETTPKSELKNNIKELKEELEQTKVVVGEQRKIIEQQLETNRVLSNAFEELSIVVLDEVLPKLEKDVVDMTPIEPIDPEEEESEGENVIDATPIEDTAQLIESEEETEEADEPVEDEGED